MKFRKLSLVFISYFFLIYFSALKVPKVSAVSSSVVIYQAQTAGAVAGTASQEIVLLYNISSQDINITNWCIKYTSSTDSSGFNKCLSPPDSKTELWLTSGGMVSFATTEFISANIGFTPDIIFSAGMAATSGHLRIIDSTGAEVDKLGWGSAMSPEGTAVPAHTTGKVLSRNLTALSVDTDNNFNDFSSKTIHSPITGGLYEKPIIIDLCPNIEGIQEVLPEGFLLDDSGDCYLDLCTNLPGLQITIPDGYYIEGGSCLEIPLENRPLVITEIYPDAPSYDTGFEFIEIYNPNSELINLKGYVLQVGPSFTKQFIFDSGVINPGQYLTFSDTQTGIVLPNSSGVALRLIAPAGNTVSESDVYQNASDQVSWAIVDDTWIFTNQKTPNSANKPYLQQAEEEVLGATTVLAPCPDGKYRNPDTNRCRNLETAISVLTPCNEDEYRNPETNRCRKVSSSSSSLTPCKLGQERNPDTNRCRFIATTKALASCPEGQERNPETNRCRKIVLSGVNVESDLADVQDVAVKNTDGQLNWPVIAGSFGSTMSYMVYEWRNELRQKLYILRKK